MLAGIYYYYDNSYKNWLAMLFIMIRDERQGVVRSICMLRQLLLSDILSLPYHYATRANCKVNIFMNDRNLPD